MQELLDAELPEINDLGANQNTGVIYNTPGQRGTSHEYVLRRLKRDNPALAEKVIKGELSANRAGVFMPPASYARA